MTSVVDFMAQPSINHEPTDTPEPIATLVDADTFNRIVGFSGFNEPVPSMNRAYTFSGGRWYAVELDVEVTC